MTTGAALQDAGTRIRTLAVWQDRVRIRVHSKGSGPALVFFHGSWGLAWDPFLESLAAHFTVHAPEHPGTSPESPEDIHALDGLWDLVLCYDEVLEALGLERALLVGHSFGAMVACEVAAAYPRRVQGLVLIDPLGFWRDGEPVRNWMMLDPTDLPAYVFHDPHGDAARRLFGASDGDDAEARVRVMWAMGATGKFIWPIPDKGLKKRIHRVSAPTLVVWGAEDRIASPAYAGEFARRIRGARTRIVDGCGHAPHLERPEDVAALVRELR